MGYSDDNELFNFMIDLLRQQDKEALQKAMVEKLLECIENYNVTDKLIKSTFESISQWVAEEVAQEATHCMSFDKLADSIHIKLVEALKMRDRKQKNK